MNTVLVIAGTLCIILGIIHSLLGEKMIFQKVREGRELIPSKALRPIKKSHWGILWATWHLASVFGWCIAGFLFIVAGDEGYLMAEETEVYLQIISFSMLLGSALVSIGTKGRHPGWVVLLAIGLLLFFGV